MIENANLYGRLNLYAWRDRLTQYPLEAVRTVGLKTLKNKLSEYVRLAASGETVVITVVDVAGDNQCIRPQLHDLAVEPREERLVLNVPVESVELVSQMRVSWNPADRRLLLSTCPENQPSEKAKVGGRQGAASLQPAAAALGRRDPRQAGPPGHALASPDQPTRDKTYRVAAANRDY